jgi:tripartite-type tricarboxylate transporter receptor subunit TctC
MAVLASAGACEAQVAAGIAATEPYPSRPVRIIVPFGAGGPGDLFARLIAQQLGENLGKAFYIENHPGAAGNIGTALAARAPADGYTLVVVSSTFMINATLYPKLPYDPIKDSIRSRSRRRRRTWSWLIRRCRRTPSPSSSR